MKLRYKNVRKATLPTEKGSDIICVIILGNGEKLLSFSQFFFFKGSGGGNYKRCIQFPAIFIWLACFLLFPDLPSVYDYFSVKGI